MSGRARTAGSRWALRRARPPGDRGTASRSPTGNPTAGRRPHRGLLEGLGLDPPGIDRLEAYIDLVARWNERVNLTAAQTPEDRVRLLIAPVVLAVSVPAAGRLIDVGSGNGSPGLVLALLRDDLQVVLLEPRSRRWAFLREAARAAGRPEVETLRLRHDQYAGPPARTVTLRAVALPLSELSGLVEAGGRVLVFGGKPTAAAPFRLEQTQPLGQGDLFVFGRAAGGPAGDVSRET